MPLHAVTRPRKIITPLALIIIAAGILLASESLAQWRWKREMLSPGLAAKTVVIDPGHGGADPGAVAGGVREADLNMELARVLKAKLEAKGAKVVFTREGNAGLVAKDTMTYAEQWVILELRKKLAFDRKGHIMVSLHMDSNNDPRVTGSKVYYSDEKSRGLAECINNRLAEAGFGNRPVERRNFTVICGTAMPSVLVEAGFISNRHDRRRVTAQKELVAAALCQGIGDYTAKLKDFEQPGKQGAGR